MDRTETENFIRKPTKYKIRTRNTHELPFENRDFTDTYCLYIFLFFGAIFFINCIYGFIRGNSDHLVAPYDPDGKRCGFGKMKKYPYLYTADPKENFENMNNACVQKCPKNGKEVLICQINSKVTSCGNLKPRKSFSFLKRCIPKPVEKKSTKVKFENSPIPVLLQITIVTSASILGAFFLALVMLSFYSKCPTVTVKVNTLFFILLYTTMTIFFTFKAWSSNYNVKVNGQLRKSNNKDKWMLTAVLWIFWSIFICLIGCIWKRILFLSKLLRLTGKFMERLKSIIIVPILTTAMSVCLFLTLCYSVIALMSLSKMKFINHTYPKPEATIWVYISVGLSGFFYGWAQIFLTHWKNFVLFSLSGYWYFSSTKTNLSSVKYFCRSLGDSITHSGTLALGSFIMFVVTMIRKGLEKKRQEAEDANVGVTIKLFIWCLQTLWRAIEIFLQFLTKHAYIETALYGTGLKDSASNSMAIIRSNFLNLGVMVGMCDMLLVTQSLIISSFVTIIFKLVYMFLDISFNLHFYNWTLAVSQSKNKIIAFGLIFTIDHLLFELYGHFNIYEYIREVLRHIHPLLHR